MNDPRITLEFDEHEGLYWPGDVISGIFFIDLDAPQRPPAIEVSVLWHTVGKGDEDFGVHYFQRETSSEDRPLPGGEPRRFATELPPSPLSYDGIIVKIRWCVRVRVFLPSGREAVAEQPFQLGLMPRPSLPKPRAAAAELR